MAKLIIFTAPSGAGKTTIVKHLLKKFNEVLSFSVSATTRSKRETETYGKDYYFLSTEEFQKKLADGDFIEWQEVYPNQFYGTLRQEIERLWKDGKNVVFDIDVQGAINLKNAFPDETLAIFVQPPSYEVLEQRLRNRHTEDNASLEKRLAKAKKD